MKRHSSANAAETFCASRLDAPGNGHAFGTLPAVATPQNLRYLTTKRDRLGHQLESLDERDLPAVEVS